MNSKVIVIVLLLAVSFLFMTVPTLATNNVNGVRYLINITMPAGHDHIYLYDQPSSSNGKNLGRIDNGEFVTGISSVERKGYTWVYCNYNGIKGYIRMNNLVKVSNGSSSTSSEFRSSSSNGSVYSGKGTVSFSGNVNIRTGPGIGYDVIGSVYQGQTLNYAGETRNDNRGVAWYSVNYSGRNGWVSSKYSNIHGESSSASNYTSDPTNGSDASTSNSISNSGASPDNPPRGTIKPTNTSVPSASSSGTVVHAEGHRCLD